MVVKGSRVTVGDKVSLLQENESTYIPPDQHRFASGKSARTRGSAVRALSRRGRHHGFDDEYAALLSRLTAIALVNPSFVRPKSDFRGNSTGCRQPFMHMAVYAKLT